ncbi:MAG: hypothetical protein KUG83_11015 [Gammaproteobacteria bacterium]|nr:hypothetical protein [Gammaproteobacteria bacterium]
MKKIILIGLLTISLQGCFQVCGTEDNIQMCLNASGEDGGSTSSTSTDSGSSWGGSSWSDWR